MVYEMSQLMRLWYLSHRRPAKVQTSLRICAVSPKPSLFAHLKYGSRQRVRPKNQTSSPTGWLRMCVWRFSLRRAKSAIISWAILYSLICSSHCILKDKSSARSTFMPWSSKSFTAKTNFISKCHLQPFNLIELKFHNSHMNNADATWVFRHVPSINSACKISVNRQFTLHILLCWNEMANFFFWR